MQTNRRNAFTTIRTDGGLLPADLLVRIAEGDRSIDGLTPESYHLAKSERLNEAATRAWNRLQGAWEGFRGGMDRLPESDAGTTLTRERWLLILFQELGYGRLQTAKAVEIDGKSYPISHAWQATPIHLVSFRQELDRRTPGARGASRVSPHSLVQELLSRSDDHLWGFVSNGLRLRLLRDNASLTRAACVEFDLQSMMEGEVYSDFFLLFLLCHQSRVEVPEGKTVEHCWLERWYNTSLREGTRVLDRLRDGVEQAIEALGGGFLSHPANTALRDKLRAGTLATQDYYRQVLRVVYRLLFLFVAEDRDLLLLPAGEDARLAAARDLYIRYYSTQRLRRLAERRRSARHADLYRALRLVFAKLHSGCPELALPALGSYLFAPTSTPDLNDADIANADLLAAVWNLTFTADGNVRRSVDYRNLGPEELGSVYESLLEMHPDVHLEAGKFKLRVAAGSERKTTGSYYTPTSLVNCLLDSALEPVLDEACKKPDAEQALLDLKVCDPACGSGHFLIAAAHRIAKRLAAIRAGEDEPAPKSIQHALRDVVSRCIYGVDINPMAVELCKINLWMEALEPGRPLTFLDHHIRAGNSLLGTTPALMKRGIPDDAFKPLEGDDRAVCSELKRRNRDERRGQGLLPFGQPQWLKLGNLVQSFANLTAEDDSTPEALAAKEQHFVELVCSTAYENARMLADAWCAAFVCEKYRNSPLEITEAIFRRWEDNPHYITPAEKEELLRLRDQYNFFHWHLAFPEVFKPKPTDQIGEDELAGWAGGFDAILGNPPYGAAQSRRGERLLLNCIQPVGSATANSAADFLLLCQRAIRPKRRVGLVVPKSLTYSFSWVPVRDDLLPSITHVIDVSEAWEEVLLEQVLVTYTSRRPDTNAQTPRLGRMTGSTTEWAADEASEAVRRLGIIPTGLTERDTRILAAMLRNSDGLLERICATQRGTGLQRLVVTDGTIPVLAGRDIADFELRPIDRFITEDILASAPVRLTQGPTAVFQNIVAHITRPENHIKLTGCVVTDRLACLDTVNLVTPLEDSDVSPWAIAAYLMSDIVNWFVYVCIYNRAVRTMHFDGYFLRKIPVPKTQVFGALDQLGKALSEQPRHEALWTQLNEVVYTAFGVPRELAVAISNGRNPRYWPAPVRQPRPAAIPAVAAEQVQIGRAVAYLNLLLHTWGKPVVRDALEAGLVFMLNDSIRQRVLRGSRTAQPAAAGRGHFLSGMDTVLSNMKANGAIDTRTETGRMVVSIGRQPISIVNAPAADVAKAKEAIQAVQKLGESRTAAEYAEVFDVGYALV